MPFFALLSYILLKLSVIFFRKIFAQSLVIVMVISIVTIFIYFLGIITEGLGEFKQPVIEYLTLMSNPQNSIQSIMGLGILISNFLKANILKLLNPFSYLMASTLAGNSTMVTNNIEGGRFIISIGVLIVWSIIFSIVGGLIAMRKEQI